jgi:hypothetical protein
VVLKMKFSWLNKKRIPVMKKNIYQSILGILKPSVN